MNQEWLMFLGSATLLVVYLCLSAATEMGTKLPWNQVQDDDEA